MAVDERRRAELFDRLSATIGDDAARTMFEMLPPPGREVATSEDVRQMGEQLRGEMAELRTELRGELRAMKHEMSALFGEEIHRAFVSQTRIIVFALVAALAAVAGISIGVS